MCYHNPQEPKQFTFASVLHLLGCMIDTEPGFFVAIAALSFWFLIWSVAGPVLYFTSPSPEGDKYHSSDMDSELYFNRQTYTLHTVPFLVSPESCDIEFSEKLMLLPTKKRRFDIENAEKFFIVPEDEYRELVRESKDRVLLPQVPPAPQSKLILPTFDPPKFDH